jgi:hypothetical protein
VLGLWGGALLGKPDTNTLLRSVAKLLELRQTCSFRPKGQLCRTFSLVSWAGSRPELHGLAFVEIGNDSGGGLLPRLVVAFTDKGSLVGVCGYVIWA